MEYALRAKSLTRHYGNFSLENVCFDLPGGCIMGLIGENGAGKTTTLKLLLNIIRKDGGEAEILGLDSVRDEKKIKMDIGVVLDESSFHDNLKTKDIGAMMRRIYPQWDDALYTSYLQRFKLPGDKIIKEFSRGMKTKLSIAAALAHRPRLLLLDEATGGLDPVARADILDILREFIQDEEHAVLLSTHIVSDLEKAADYITLLHEGKRVFTRSKDALVYEYGILRCGLNDFEKIAPEDMEGSRKSRFGCEVLVKDREKAAQKYRDFVIDRASVEEIMLFYVRGEEQ